MESNKCRTAMSALLLAGLLALSAGQGSPPTVTVAQGQLAGTAETFAEANFLGVEQAMNVFRGVPYAEPPVGNLRFRPAMPRQPWAGVYNASAYGPACIQDPALAFGPISEDCLHMNIYAPAGKEGLPVMVWMDGGGFVAGNPALANTYGQPLAAVGDVIVVTFNYRLNLFGFLTTNDGVLPGNLGMRDQVMALRWIKENIASFGGDAERITIFGGSSGAQSVGFHMLSDQSQGLFNQGIMQSGTVFSPLASPDIPDFLRQQTFGIGEKVGCKTEDSAALVECMREKSAEELFGAWDPNHNRAVVTVDGIFLKDRPENLYLSGQFNRGNLLLGSNRDDGTLFLLYDPLFAQYLGSSSRPNISRELLTTVFRTELYYFYDLDPNENSYLIDAVMMRYVDWATAEYPNADFFDTYVRYATDSAFTCNDDIVARAHALGGANVYRYQMTHVPTSTYLGLLTGTRWLGAGHAEEILFMFGAPFIGDLQYVFQFTDEERAFSAQMMRYWTNFARTGNPNLREPGPEPEDVSLNWPRFTIPELHYKVLDLEFSTGRALKSSECHFWTNYIRKLVTLMGELASTEREWRQSYYSWKYTDLANWREEFAKYRASRN